jgi:RND family efflux transporter MFP subunit
VARLACVLAVVGCASEPPPPPPQATPVDLVTVEVTQVAETSEYLASLRPRTAAGLLPQVEGQVTKIFVRPGDRVRAGQPLMQIDPGSQPAAVAQARASQASREASLRLAETELARTRTLFQAGAVARQELDRAQATVTSARADVAALGAQITSGRVQLRYYKIVAPANGVVGDIPVRVGDRVTPQTQLTTVTDNGVLEASISIPTEDAGRLTPQSEIQLLDDRDQLLATGRIRFVSPRVQPDTQAVLAEADIPNPNGTLRAAQLTRARVVWRTHEGVMIPALAVMRMGGQPFVYLAEQTARGLIARQRPVDLGELTGQRYVVNRGLASGDRIVTSNVQKIRDGAPITPAPARPGPPAGSAAPAPDTGAKARS